MSVMHARWADGIRAVHDEAAGVLQVVVIRATDAVDLFSAALAGNAEAARLFRVVADASERIAASRETTRPALCASCPRTLRDNAFAFAVALPACDDPTNAVALAVCRRCARSTDDIRRKATFALKQLWPEARPIEVHPTAGRA